MEDYELEQTRCATIIRFRVPRGGTHLITGRWGWDPVPSDIRWATVATTDSWYRANILIPAREENQEELRGTLRIPRDIERILEPWRVEAQVG